MLKRVSPVAAAVVPEWDAEGELSACAEALGLIRGQGTARAWREAVARLELGSAGGVPGAQALHSWEVAADLADGVEGVVAVGALAAGFRRGVPLPELAATVPLEFLAAEVDAPRLRLRLVARGFTPEAEGWLAGPGGGRVVIRHRLVPAGFGRVPVLIFSEGAERVDLGPVQLPVAAPGASWAAAVARAGAAALAGSRWARLALTVAALEADRLPVGEREVWRGRLRLWGIGRLAAVVEAWLDRLQAGGRGSGELPEFRPAGPATLHRLLAGMRLQRGAAAALRFAAAQLLGDGEAGWV